MRKDVLAAGYKTAQFAAGNNTGEIELKNVSTEPRNEFTPVEIDRTRKVRRIVPKGDTLLVSRRAAENLSAGGLVIPEEAIEKERPAEGVIEAMGPKCGQDSERPTIDSISTNNLHVGDHIIFGKYAGTEYPWGGETLLFMSETEVIAVIED
jgi:chaperonin GroES